MSPDCPRLELLAAFVDGNLPERSEPRKAVEAHLASCELCRAKVAMAMQLEDADDSAEDRQRPSGSAIDKNTLQFQPANYR
jgi:anti-sigma factor RsiW